MTPKVKHALCDSCPGKDATYVPSSFPDKKVRLAIVGEAPGWQEQREGKPFCLVPETRVLTADLRWVPLGELRIGDRVLSVDEHSPPSTGASNAHARKWRVATVTATHAKVAETVTVTTEHGALTGTPDHRVLTGGASARWLELRQLSTQMNRRNRTKRCSSLRFVATPWEANTSYTAGWLAGFLDGEGYVSGSREKSKRRAGVVGWCQNDGVASEYAMAATHALGFDIVNDGQARYKNSTCRVFTTRGGKIASMQLLGQVRPVRLIQNWQRAIDGSSSCRNTTPSPVVSRVPAGQRQVVDITTTTGTYIAEGFIVHNCGASGQMLERVYHRAGIAKSEIFFSNAVACAIKNKDDLDAARKCCAKRLTEELKESGATTVLAVGAYGLHSAASLKAKPAILKFRGSVLEADDPLRHESGPWTVIASVHPAFIMRTPVYAPTWEHVFVNDVERACDIALNGYLPPEKRPGARLIVATDLDTLREELPKLDETVIVDIETVELTGKNTKSQPPNIHTNILTCLVIADTKTAVTIPISKTQKGEGKFWNGEHHLVIAAINACLETRIAVTHNGPCYDHTGLQRAGIVLKRWEDSLSAYHAMTSYFPKRLGHVVSCYLAAPPWKEWPHNVNLEALWAYNGRDGLYNAQAWKELEASLDEDDRRVYEHDKKNAVICTRMSRNGFQYDSAKATELAENLEKRKQEVVAESKTLVGKDSFNILSNVQLADFIFKQCRVPILEETESGEPSVNKGVMRALAAGKNELVSKLALAAIEVRSLTKCRSTYITSKKWKPHADGRVRATFQSWGTISGRFSARDPNLTNLPTKRADPSLPWGGIRSLYTAGPGRTLVYFDAKQMEFRVAAYASGDKNMIAVCEDPVGDIHTANARKLFPHFDSVGKDTQKGLRDLAKRAVFAVNYFAEAETIYENLVAEGVLITLQAVKAMLATMKEQFPHYYGWQAQNLDAVIRTGYSLSPILGRKRHLGHAPKPQESANFPIQSGASDVMNEKLQRIENCREERNLDALLVSVVYDSATWDTAFEDVGALRELVEHEWRQPVEMNGNRAVFPIDVKTGFRWSEM